jgi:hypothetical protein
VVEEGGGPAYTIGGKLKSAGGLDVRVKLAAPSHNAGDVLVEGAALPAS